jgi:5-methylcytosine-specific restriction endonuclease McrBC regulatory subunit McrC
MVLVQEYGDPVEIQGNPSQLVEAFDYAEEHWSARLGTNEVFDVTPRPDGVEVRPLGVTGQVTVAGETIEIVPKYLFPEEIGDWHGSIADIIAFSQTESFDLVSSASGERDVSTFVDLLAGAFTQELQDGLRHGLPTEYVRKKETTGTVRGRLVVEELYPQVLKDPTKVVCETDELSVDTTLGKTLRWAAREYARLTTDPTTRSQLLELENRLSEASQRPPSLAELDRLFVPPQYRRFERAVELATWLRRNEGPSLRGDELDLQGVLISTHDLYQDFVDACLSYLSRNEGWTFAPEPPTHLSTEPSNLTAYPDHVLQTPEGALLLDSKYVVTADWTEPDNRGEKKPDLSEVYQVMAAGRVRGIQDVGLVYPAVSDRYSGPWVMYGEGDPVRLHLVEIDPSSFKLSEIEAFTASIQREIHSTVLG